MLFYLLGGVFIFIFIMSGDVEGEKLKKDKQDWKKIIGEEYL